MISEGLDEETLLLCELIRDADKCDIFRWYACENMLDAIGETEQQVACETISESVYQSVMEHRCVKKEERKTGLDIWVSFLAFLLLMYGSEQLPWSLGRHIAGGLFSVLFLFHMVSFSYYLPIPVQVSGYNYTIQGRMNLC